MIEIKKDGPLDDKNRQPATRLRIIGLGQAGISALDQIVMYGMDMYDMLVIDTDQQTLEGSIVKQKMQLGVDQTRGIGCGGDHELASEVAGLSEEKLAEAVDGCDPVGRVRGYG